MKVYNREEFLRLPAGTVYRKECGAPICIKDETIYNDDGIGIDFFCTSLDEFESSGTNQRYDRLFQMLKDNSISYPLEIIGGRDGCFDNDDIFVIFEKSDIQILINALKECL